MARARLWSLNVPSFVQIVKMPRKFYSLSLISHFHHLYYNYVQILW